MWNWKLGMTFFFFWYLFELIWTFSFNFFECLIKCWYVFNIHWFFYNYRSHLPVTFTCFNSIDSINSIHQMLLTTLSKGKLIIELYWKSAPNTCRNFATLSHRGYYNDTPIHRIVANKIIQAGDPTGKLINQFQSKCCHLKCQIIPND